MLPITEPRHGRALQQSLGIRGPDAPTHLESTLQGVVIVDDVTRRDEYADSPHIRKVFGTLLATGDATHTPQLWIPNSTTGSLFIVRRLLNISYSGPNGITVYPGLIGSAPAQQTSVTGQFKNLRLATLLGLVPAFSISAAGNAANYVALGSPWTTIAPLSSLFPAATPLQLDVVVPPGFSFVVRGTDANSAVLQVTFEWDELTLAPA